MSSSPTAKAAEKKHKDNKEDNFSLFLGSIGWKEGWATNRSEIVRVDELSKLTNEVVHGLEKRITMPTLSKTKIWEILKALAPPGSLSMQADINKFYRKLHGNKVLRNKKYSRNVKDWYTKSFVFSKITKKRGYKV